MIMVAPRLEYSTTWMDAAQRRTDGRRGPRSRCRTGILLRDTG